MPFKLSRPYLAWYAVCLVWGTTYLAIRISIETIPPMLMSGFRWTIAGSLIVAALKIRGAIIPARAQWRSLAIIGVLLIGFGNGAVVWAEQTVPSGLTAVLVAMAPFWMVGIEALMPGGEALTLRRVAGLLVGFAGIILLVWPDLRLESDRGFLAGVAATQLASAGWALGSVYARRRGKQENVLAAVAIEMLFGGLFLTLAGSVRGEWSMLVFSPRSTAAFLYLIFIGAIVGFSAYAYALKHLPIATVSLYAYINPLIAVVLGALVLSEPISVRVIAAAGVVLGGMALVRDA